MIDYDPHSWRQHLFDLRGSMLREIIVRVSACVLWSIVVVAFHRHVTPVAIPGTAHGYIGLALSLLLVFRTNASYDRFWEGRRQWGSIVNESRNLARGAIVHLKEVPSLRDDVIRWTVAFAYATMASLRGMRSLGPAGEQLPRAKAEAVLTTSHVPLEIATYISERLAQARDEGVISDYVLMGLDQNVQQLIDYLGACERIRKTPLPFPYMVHLRRALILYCFTLPFALLREFGWATILDTLLIAYILFGIEEIGVEIEDPFGDDINDLPLEQICTTIDRNLTALMENARGSDTHPTPTPSSTS